MDARPRSSLDSGSIAQEMNQPSTSTAEIQLIGDTLPSFAHDTITATTMATMKIAVPTIIPANL